MSLTLTNEKKMRYGMKRNRNEDFNEFVDICRCI